MIVYISIGNSEHLADPRVSGDSSQLKDVISALKAELRG
jgi:hypothetical protein